ncbi:MAG: NAD(P)H-dependent oxidoreductase [Patescibacteria group bacterium]|jgi:putative NADPH-quinone reductase
MKKILLVLGHPNTNSLNRDLLESYYQSALKRGHEVRKIFLGEINFNLNLKEGYNEVQELEPDLKKAQEDILWADHLVFVFPIWWYNLPAVFKGFIDRVFLPGFAFKFENNSSIPDKLLTGKTADIICTSGAPKIYYFIKGGNSGAKILKNTLNFCGIKVRRKILLGSISGELKAEKLDKYHNIIQKMVIK